MSVRPRFQRAFLAWLTDARPRLALQPRLRRRSDAMLVVGFDGLVPEIEAEITRDPCGSSCSIIIPPPPGVGGATMLLYLDADVVVVPGGYSDPHDEAPRPTVFPNRESAWRQLLFESFLVWTNTKLAKAEAIAMLRTEDFVLGDPDRGLWARHPSLMTEGELLSPAPPGYALERIVSIKADPAVTPLVNSSRRSHGSMPAKSVRLTKLKLGRP